MLLCNKAGDEFVSLRSLDWKLAFEYVPGRLHNGEAPIFSSEAGNEQLVVRTRIIKLTPLRLEYIQSWDLEASQRLIWVSTQPKRRPSERHAATSEQPVIVVEPFTARQ